MSAQLAADLAREQMNIVIVGHVDHGKSTLVGRLLADSNSLPDGKLEHVQAICKRQGKVFEYAFLLDALEAEQDQGITIDSARCFFKTDQRDIIIIDAPGHIEFLKNMISGAARAEAAFLLIDAHEGVQENSRRHGYMLGMLGIKQINVVVNKMDLVDGDQATFARIEAEYRAFLKEIGMTPERFIPISARDGDNVAIRSKTMEWYDGPTVLEAVDLFTKAPPQEDLPFRLPVQDVYKFNARGDDRRIVAGRIESGSLKVGDEVLFSPSNKTSTVKSIEGFNIAPTDSAAAPNATGVTLTEQIYVGRGEVMTKVDVPPKVSTRFRANIVWLARQPMTMNTWYKLKLGTQELPCRIHELTKVLDASELSSDSETTEVGRHDVAEMVLETKSPVAFDLVADFEATSRFVLVDAYEIAGGGIILDSVEDNLGGLRADMRDREFAWVTGDVSNQDRSARFGHSPALVLLTGGTGVGKAAVARVLEKKLFDAGLNTYLLDGKNMALGVDHDIAEQAAAQADEILRRFAEVAHLFMDAGTVVVSTSNTFALADHGRIRTLVSPFPVVHVHVGDDPVDADLTLTGVDGDVDTAVEAIRSELESRGFVSG